MKPGEIYTYELLTHCGIAWTPIDGRWWRTSPLNDGSGNPPPGWDNAYQVGRLTIVDSNTAVFEGGPIPLTFERTDHISSPAGGCD